MKNYELKDIVEWYKKIRPTYVKLAKEIEAILSKNLNLKSINYYHVTSRTKTADSFRENIEKGKYKQPKIDCVDFAGIRVITYVNSEIPKICNLIKSLFVIDQKRSTDKRKSLGIDRLGYRSIHFIARLSADRTKLFEYEEYKDLWFEIQVRTILEHAWAEIEHDRNYKYQGVLPDHIKRRFMVLSGVLELADREFDAISQNIDKYTDMVSKKTSQGKFDIDINTASLKEYLQERFKDEISRGLNPTFLSKDDAINIIKELRDFDITTLDELEKIIPQDLSKITQSYVGESNFIGLLRLIMIINDIKKYFQKSWKGHWKFIKESTIETLKEFNVSIEDYMESKGLRITYD